MNRTMPSNPKPDSDVPSLTTLGAVVLCLIGGIVIGAASSAVQELVGLALFVTAAILFAGAMVTRAITQLRVDLWRYHGGDEAPRRSEESTMPTAEELQAAREQARTGRARNTI